MQTYKIHICTHLDDLLAEYIAEWREFCLIAVFLWQCQVHIILLLFEFLWSAQIPCKTWKNNAETARSQWNMANMLWVIHWTGQKLCMAQSQSRPNDDCRLMSYRSLETKWWLPCDVVQLILFPGVACSTCKRWKFSFKVLPSIPWMTSNYFNHWDRTLLTWQWPEKVSTALFRAARFSKSKEHQWNSAGGFSASKSTSLFLKMQPTYE